MEVLLNGGCYGDYSSSHASTEPYGGPNGDLFEFKSYSEVTFLSPLNAWYPGITFHSSYL
jgi:hypothetical protein